jgi:hypothetical protein
MVDKQMRDLENWLRTYAEYRAKYLHRNTTVRRNTVSKKTG